MRRSIPTGVTRWTNVLTTAPDWAACSPPRPARPRENFRRQPHDRIAACLLNRHFSATPRSPFNVECSMFTGLLGRPLDEPTHSRSLPGGEQNIGRATTVPQLGGVRGGFMVPTRDS